MEFTTFDSVKDTSVALQQFSLFSFETFETKLV